MTRSALVVAVALGVVGCWHTDVVRVAPGNIDVRARPRPSPYVGTVETPDDPGESYLVVSPGVTGAGAVVVDHGAVNGAYVTGGELTVLYGTSAHSHHEDDFLIFPERAFGVSAGASAALVHGGSTPAVVYFEAQYSVMPCGVAAGWAFDVALGQSGPQATAFCGPLYARAMHVFGDRTEASVGLLLKLPHAFVWAR